MDVKLVLLMSCLIVANCKSAISHRNGTTDELCEDMKSEMGSIRQQLMNLKHATVRIEKHTLREMKSEIEDIRKSLMQQQNRPKKECPFGFDYLPETGRCYTIIFEEMTWDRATARCRGILPGVHLAALTSQEEHDAVASYVQSQFNGTSFRSSSVEHWCPGGYLVWLSGQTKNARCNNPFVWKPFSGIEVPFNYTNWGSGEPNCAGDEACVHMASCMGLAWNDYRCHFSSFPLCEI